MQNKLLSADEIYQLALTKIAPLPCQESYLRELSAIVAFHIRKNALIDKGFQPSELPCQSAIVVAPTGAGKTFVLRELAKMLDLNTIILDCSSMSRDGWKGASFGQQLLASKKECKDLKKWEASLVFLDEIDKAKLFNTHHDQANIQDNLLQLFNYGTIAVENGDRVSENLYVGRFTIILGGAFSGLEKIIERRITSKSAIGFTNRGVAESKAPANLMQYASISDVEQYGIKRELLARIGSIITVDPMQEQDYRALLTSEHGSIQRRYRDYFANSSGVAFEISDSAVKYLCEFCKGAPTGARAVNPAINDVMRKAITMVDRDAAINKVILDADENGCILKYEYGERTIVPLVQKVRYTAPYMIRARDIESMTDNLCSFYEERSASMPKAELVSFIKLALTYLKCYTRPGEFHFESLEKLAEATDKRTKEYLSPFDIIITDVLKKPAHSKSFDTMYEEFSKHWTPDYTHNLVEALIRVRSRIEDQHQCSSIRFSVYARMQ